MHGKIGAVTLAMLCACSTAQAVNTDSYGDVPYVSVFGVKQEPDPERDTHAAGGFQITGALPLQNPHWSIEGSLFDIRRIRSFDDQDDFQRGFLINGVRDFGLHDWNVFYLPKFKPYLIGGGGLVDDDVQSKSHFNFGIDLGGGLLFPIGYRGIAVRFEGVALGSENSSKDPGETRNYYLDYNISLGFEIPLTVLRKSAPINPLDVTPPCTTRIDPYTGQKSCVTAPAPAAPGPAAILPTGDQTLPPAASPSPAH